MTPCWGRDRAFPTSLKEKIFAMTLEQEPNWHLALRKARNIYQIQHLLSFPIPSSNPKLNFTMKGPVRKNSKKMSASFLVLMFIQHFFGFGICWHKCQPPGYFQISFKTDISHHDLDGGIPHNIQLVSTLNT